MPSPSNPPTLPPRAGIAGDIWGGFASMLVALPSSIAYGVAVFSLLGEDFVARGVRAGLVGAMALGVTTAAVGGAPRLISAPCAPAAAVLSALVAGALGGAAPAPPERILAVLALVALLSAGLQMAYGLAGGGKLIKFIPYPVVSGYLSGVGVIIFLGQLPKFLGLAHGVPLGAALLAPETWHWTAVAVGLATVGGVLLAPLATKAVPAPVVGLATGLLCYFALSLRLPELLHVDHNPLVVGPVGGGAGALLAGFTDQWRALTGWRGVDWTALVVPALTLSVLLSVDTLKTGVVIEALTQDRHDSNRALLAQGAGNLAAVLAGGMAGSGTMGPTLVNVQSGGHSRLSGLTEGLLTLAAMLVLGRAIAWVPVPALAGILLVVAVRMFDWGSLHLLRRRETVVDFAVIATVVVVAVTANLIAASGAGVALAILLFLREQVRTSVIRRKITGAQASSTQHRLATEQAVLEQHGAETVVCELQGSLFFGTTDQLLNELEPTLAECRYLILDLRRVQSVDYTAVHQLERIEGMLAGAGGWLLFSRVPAHLPTGRNLQEYFTRLGVVDPRRRVRRFESLDDALVWAEDRVLAEHLPARAGDEAPPLALAEFDLVREFDADQTLAAFASCAEPRAYAQGQVIFRAGDTGCELFLVRRGVVRVMLPLRGGGHHNLASFGRGNFFGEMAFLTGQARSAEAVATTATELYVVERPKLDAVSQAHPLVGVKIFRRVARTLAVRLRHANAELRALYDA